MVENIKIGLTTHPINDRNEWVKRNLRRVDSRPKVYDAEIASDSTEEATHLIVEVMKG